MPGIFLNPEAPTKNIACIQNPRKELFLTHSYQLLREVGSPKAVPKTGGSGRANVQGQWHSIVFQYRRHSLVQYQQILIYSSHFRIGTVSNRTLWYPLVFAIVPRQDGARTCCYKLLLGLEPNRFVWLSFVIIIWEFCAGRPTYLGVFIRFLLLKRTPLHHLIFSICLTGV